MGGPRSEARGLRPPPRSGPRVHRLRLAALGAAVVLLDQLTKLAVVRALAPGESRRLVDGVVYLTHVRNEGAAFGILRGVPGLLVLASIAGLAVFAVILWRRPPPLTATGASLVAAGALGNLVDRAVRGKVVDFVDFRVWPAFNVADAAITVGAGLLLLASFRERRQDVS